VAVQGANVEALTGDDTFRVPLARCSLESEGRKVLVRDPEGSLVIWSDDDDFLGALEKAQRGLLSRQVRRLRAAARRRSVLKWGGFAVIAVGTVCAAAIPATRWAIGGGIPQIGDRIGESAIEHLDLPTGVAPEADGALMVIAEQLRPPTEPSIRSFRLLLAGYSEAHSFGIPPRTVVVTAGLICDAKGPEVVAAVVARELAHLERRDVSKRVAEAVDWHTAFDLAHGDVSALRARVLDFADPGRDPGFTHEQQSAAEQRASVILASAAAPQAANDHDGQVAPSWAKVRAEACGLAGR
jgi:hypothetical protein